MEQKSFSFDKETLVKIAKGAAIAGGATILTYLAEHLGDFDFGQNTGIIVGILSIAINAGKEYINGAKN